MTPEECALNLTAILRDKRGTALRLSRQAAMRQLPSHMEELRPPIDDQVAALEMAIEAVLGRPTTPPKETEPEKG